MKNVSRPECALLSAPTIRLATAGAVLALLAACGEAPPPEPEVRPVRTLVVAPAATKISNTYAGEVRARYESALGFRVGGKITERKVEVGGKVRRGQTLFVLDNRDLSLGAAAGRAQVAQAQAQLKSAQLDLDRYRQLLGKGYISRSELDRQQALYDATRAGLEATTAQSAQFANQSGYAVLAADADGVVTAVLAEAGQVVAAGAPVVRVARTAELEVASAIPEDQIGRIREGMPVSVTLWVDSQRAVPAQVREVASSADPLTRTYPVRVSLAAEPPEGMRLGMTASLSVPQAAPAMVHVPSVALVTQNGAAGVFVLDPKTMTPRFRPLQMAGVEGNDVLVVDGLAPGEEVITAGAALLREDQKVKRMVTAAAATIAAPGGAAAKPAIGATPTPAAPPSP